MNTFNSLLDAELEDYMARHNMTDGYNVPTNRYNALFMHLYKTVIYQYKDKSIPYIGYHPMVLDKLIDWYIMTCYQFDIASGVNGFSLLTNIPMATLSAYRDVNAAVSNIYISIPYTYDDIVIYSDDLINFISDDAVYYSIYDEEMERVEASTLYLSLIPKLYVAYREVITARLNDDKTGIIVNANNNKDIGLEYNKQTIINNVSARKLISISDLPKLN